MPKEFRPSSGRQERAKAALAHGLGATMDLKASHGHEAATGSRPTPTVWMDPRSYPSAHIKQGWEQEGKEAAVPSTTTARPQSAPTKRAGKESPSRSQLVSLVYLGPSTKLIPECGVRKSQSRNNSKKQATASWYPTAEVLKDQAATRKFNKKRA